jgi:hypothetical protein
MMVLGILVVQGETVRLFVVTRILYLIYVEVLKYE